MVKSREKLPKAREVPDLIDEMLDKVKAITPDLPAGDLEDLGLPQNTKNVPLWRRAEEARLRYERATEDANKEQARLAAAQEALRYQKESLEELEQELEKKQAELDIREEKLSKDTAALLDRKTAIQEREASAEAGFVEKQDEMLDQVHDQLEKFRRKMGELSKQAVDHEANALEGFQQELWQVRTIGRQQLAQYETQLKEFAEKYQSLLAEKSELDQERRELAEEKRQLESARLELDIENEFLDEDKKTLDQIAERKAAEKVTRLKNERDALREQLKVTRGDLGTLQRQLAAREGAVQILGAKPEDALKELRDLRVKRQELERELSTRPPEANAERLTMLESERESWEGKRSLLEQQIQELRARLSGRQIAAVEIETLRDEKLAYEASNKRLKQALHELRQEIDQELDASGSRVPFPSCMTMEKDKVLQTEPETQGVRDLNTLVNDLQNRVGYAFEETRLYYSLEDLRSFVAGLSMSYLTIMQGISGTGKTSLPMAFAKAVGGEYEVIEVQAGWRDRHDLIGHYNAFERRFYESPFLQAVYKAQCPAYSDRVFIIVMDEMNLSFPEQYFADVISAMERQIATERTINLMTVAVPDDLKPKLRLVDGGREILIPSNLWFVGTSNQDETTKDIADKTYDRAHVLELPNSYEPLDLRKPTASQVISVERLRGAFESAQSIHGKKADKGFEFLSIKGTSGSSLKDILANEFGVGWGNRLEKQFESYVPVVLAAGGTLGEAVDYLLASKILRKIRDRYDVRQDDLEALQQQLSDSWRHLGDSEDGDGHPSKSLAVIEKELDRLQRGGRRA